jgi:hypothetical protein
MGVARLSYPQVMAEVVRAHRDSTTILRAQRERLMERWLDVESGRWKPIATPAASAAAGARKYYGAQ